MKKIINGVLLVNKPLLKTSNAILQNVKHLLHAKKAGHTGSLDPLATGMLPLCFGEATKFSQYLLDADKCYEVTGKLGVVTDSGDLQGNVIHECAADHILEEALLAVLEPFRGEIQQVPPMYSALKHQGKPLYHYARQGQSIERKARTVKIYSLQPKVFLNGEFSLEVYCSKGTYIRTLVEDIGHALGVGAVVTKLHRRFCAGFENAKMFTMEELENATEEERLYYLLPMDCMLTSYEKMTLNESQKKTLYFGQTVSFDHLADELCLRLYDENENFLGLGSIQDGVLKSDRLCNTVAS